MDDSMYNRLMTLLLTELMRSRAGKPRQRREKKALKRPDGGRRSRPRPSSRRRRRKRRVRKEE